MSNCSPAKSGPMPTQPRQRAGHRHHRHQRQIHHHRAGRPYPDQLRLRRPDRRQYRQVGAGTGAARRQDRSMCWRCPVFQIDLAPGLTPDVARALQSHARSYRPPRQHGELRRHQGAAAAADRQGRPGRDRRGRCLLPPRSSPSCRPHGGAASRCRSRWARCWAAASLWWTARSMTRRAGARRQGDGFGRRARICPARTIGRMRRWPMPRPSPSSQDTRAIAAAIASFPGLAHRMEDVGRIGKVRFINDSKATNADATARALACLSRYFLDRGRQAQGRRHRKPGAAFSRASAKPI